MTDAIAKVPDLIFRDMPGFGSKKNTYAVAIRNGKPFIYLNKSSEAARASLTAFLYEQIAEQGLKQNLPLQGELELRAQILTKVDIDNALGHLFDCLQSCGIIENDKDIIDLHATKREVWEGWGNSVIIKQIETTPQEARDD